jgi:hypothetical protein
LRQKQHRALEVRQMLVHLRCRGLLVRCVAEHTVKRGPRLLWDSRPSPAHRVPRELFFCHLLHTLPLWQLLPLKQIHFRAVICARCYGAYQLSYALHII